MFHQPRRRPGTVPLARAFAPGRLGGTPLAAAYEALVPSARRLLPQGPPVGRPPTVGPVPKVNVA